MSQLNYTQLLLNPNTLHIKTIQLRNDSGQHKMLLENRLLLKKTLIPNLFGLQIILLTLIIYFKTLKKYLKTQYKSVFPVSHTAGLSALTCLQLQTVPQCFCLSACFGEQVPECLGCPG